MVFYQKKSNFSVDIDKIEELVSVLKKTDVTLANLTETDLDKFEINFRYRLGIYNELSRILMKIVNDGTLYVYSKNDNKVISSNIFVHSRIITSYLNAALDEVSKGSEDKTFELYKSYLKVNDDYASLSDALDYLLKLVRDLEKVCHTNIDKYLDTINGIITDVNEDLKLLNTGNINVVVVNKVRESLEIERRELLQCLVKVF